MSSDDETVIEKEEDEHIPEGTDVPLDTNIGLKMLKVLENIER